MGLERKRYKNISKSSTNKKMANSKMFECPTKSVRNHFNGNKYASQMLINKLWLGKIKPVKVAISI